MASQEENQKCQIPLKLRPKWLRLAGRRHAVMSEIFGGRGVVALLRMPPVLSGLVVALLRMQPVLSGRFTVLFQSPRTGCRVQSSRFGFRVQSLGP